MNGKQLAMLMAGAAAITYGTGYAMRMETVRKNMLLGGYMPAAVMGGGTFITRDKHPSAVMAGAAVAGVLLAQALSPSGTAAPATAPAQTTPQLTSAAPAQTTDTPNGSGQDLLSPAFLNDPNIGNGQPSAIGPGYNADGTPYPGTGGASDPNAWTLADPSAPPTQGGMPASKPADWDEVSRIIEEEAGAVSRRRYDAGAIRHSRLTRRVL